MAHPLRMEAEILNIRTRHPFIIARGGHSACVDGCKVAAEAGGIEHEPRRRERVRRDDVGAGRDVVGVDRAQQVVMRERCQRAPGDGVETRAAAAQLGARAAVEHERAAARERFPPSNHPSIVACRYPVCRLYSAERNADCDSGESA